MTSRAPYCKSNIAHAQHRATENPEPVQQKKQESTLRTKEMYMHMQILAKFCPGSAPELGISSMSDRSVYGLWMLTIDAAAAN